MNVDQKTIAHLAELSNFALNPEQSVALEKDLNGIITYISQLDELDTDGVEPTYQVFEMENVWRSDEVLAQEASPDDLLNLAKTTERHQIKVPKVL